MNDNRHHHKDSISSDSYILNGSKITKETKTETSSNDDNPEFSFDTVKDQLTKIDDDSHTPLKDLTQSKQSESLLILSNPPSPSSITNTIPKSVSHNFLFRDDFYPIKSIPYSNYQQCSPYYILLQSENGPCPLLAVANLLLLRGVTSLLSDEAISIKQIYNSDLIRRLSNYVCDCSTKGIQKNPSSAFDIEAATAEVLSLLPSLARGLDVNCRFNGPRSFEFTSQLSIFDLLNIPLVHGWVADINNDPELLQNMSYNQAVDYAVLHSEVLAFINDTALLAENLWMMSTMTRPKNDDSGQQQNHHRCLTKSSQASPLKRSMLSTEKEEMKAALEENNYAASDSNEQRNDDAIEQTTAMCASERQHEQDEFSSEIKVAEVVALLRKEFEQFSIESELIDEIIGSIGEHLVIACSTSVKDDKQTDSSIDQIDEIRKKLKDSIARFWEVTKIVLEKMSHLEGMRTRINEFDEQQIDNNQRKEKYFIRIDEERQLRSSKRRKQLFTDFLLDGYEIKNFLQHSADQFTITGFHQLHDCLPERKLSVLFHNQHFAVLFKLETSLYQLVTDIGFADVDEIMWERLNDISGNTTFCDAQFQPSSRTRPSSPNFTSPPQPLPFLTKPNQPTSKGAKKGSKCKTM